MNSDTEKALLEFVEALVRYWVVPQDENWGGAYDRMRDQCRAYLATLEPKPEPLRCGLCGHLWTAHYGRCTVRNCTCSVEPVPKTEPKRGVEEILRLVAAGLRYHAAKNHGGDLQMAGSIEDALRLYREEREGVAKVAGKLRAEADSTRRETGMHRRANTFDEWADELERRDG